MCARSPVDRTLASGAESVGSTPAERTIKVKLVNPVQGWLKTVFNGNIAVRYRYFVYKSGNCAFQIWSFACFHLPVIAFDIFSDCSL